MIRVLVVAGTSVMRAGLQALLVTGPTVEVVGTTTAGPGLDRRIDDLRPDVVVCETDHVDDVLATVGSIIAALHGVPLILLVGDADYRWTPDILRAGARAVLRRDVAPSELVAAAEAVAAGLIVMDTAAADAMLPVVSLASLSRKADDDVLTPREIEVLGMLAEGLGNKNIAHRLAISEHTVKFHIGSIFAKLNASSRTEAVTLGVRRGVIML